MTTVRTLRDRLLRASLDPSAVSFDAGLLTAAEQYCIWQNGPVWEVFYYERGNKNNLHSFSNEEDAADDLEKRLLADKTVWLRGSFRE